DRRQLCADSRCLGGGGFLPWHALARRGQASGCRSYGRANATIASPRDSSRIVGCPPAATTRYCLPFISYVIGVAFPAAGNAARQSSSPVSTLNARICESGVPAMKTRPPSVVIGPPRLIDPGGTEPCAPPKSFIEPKGICQAIVPLVMSTAVSVPQGGAPHGTSEGDCKKRRSIP